MLHSSQNYRRKHKYGARRNEIYEEKISRNEK